LKGLESLVLNSEQWGIIHCSLAISLLKKEEQMTALQKTIAISDIHISNGANYT